jgi:3-oxoacyl-[acyl-carrier-protein] synthase II
MVEEKGRHNRFGLTTPLGVGCDNVWQKILEGQSGVAPLTRFDASRHDTKIAAEVKDFGRRTSYRRKSRSAWTSSIQYALAAVKVAFEGARLDMAKEDAERVGVIVGTGLGGLPTLEKYHAIPPGEGAEPHFALLHPHAHRERGSGNIAIQYAIKGPNLSIVTACATGAHSIGDAFRVIQYGDADVMVAGGTEANLTPLTVGGFNALKALSTKNDVPEKASRPFDKERDGFVIGEGAGIVIMEELEHARQRGATIYAEVAGYGYNGDAYHITAPCPDGDGSIRCMRMALKDAGMSP